MEDQGTSGIAGEIRGRPGKRARPTWRTMAKLAPLLTALSAIGCESSNPKRTSGLGSVAGAGGDDASDGGASSGAGDTGAGGATGDGGDGGWAGDSDTHASLETFPVPPQTIDEEGEALLALGGRDRARLVPEDELRVVIDVRPESGTLSATRGLVPLAVVYDPRPDFAGSDSFDFYVRDAAGNRSAARTVTIEVLPVNDPPLARDDEVRTDSLTPVGIEVLRNDSDVDDSELVVADVTQPASGRAAIVSSGTVLFTPTHPDSGRVLFQYTVRDGAGAEDTAVVEVNVREAEVVHIARFDADRSEIDLGGSVTLTWEAPRADRCTLDGGGDTSGAPNGSVVVAPDESTAYTLTCEGPGGPVSAAVLVIVRGANESDADGDGLPDVVEDHTDTDPSDADTDDDGVPDGVEDENNNGRLDDGETDPRIPDSNGDGFCDGLRTDNDGNGIAPTSDCAGPVLVDGANASEVQDGLSWATAFSELQRGVDEAGPGREVWVKAGRYRAAAPNDPVLVLSDAVEVYGGFSGAETHRGARDPAPTLTILDGDFAGDDSETPAIDATHPAGNPAANRADNSQHVVYSAEDARLDGVSIYHGHATGSGVQGGGGLFALHPRMTLENVRFDGNSAVGSGGAILCVDRCDLTLTNASFEGNRAANGGAIHASPTSTQGQRFLLLENVELLRNVALVHGGAIDVRAGVPVAASSLLCAENEAEAGGCAFLRDGRFELENVELLDNVVATGAGAVYALHSALTLTSARVLRNRAVDGGGVVVWAGSASIEDAFFSENSAKHGAALFVYDATLSLEDSEASHNAAVTWGGIAYADLASLTLDGLFLTTNSSAYGGGFMMRRSTFSLRNSEMRGNTAEVSGGAIYGDSSTDADIENVRFDENLAKYGGAMLLLSASLTLRDAELTGNSASDAGGAIYLGASSSAELDSVDFLRNFARKYGAGVYAERSTYSMTNAVFSSNDSTDTGAGIHQASNADGTLDRVAFVGNRSNFGVGMMVYGPALLSARRVAFVGNSARSGGAGLQLDAQAGYTFDATVRDASFFRNSAEIGAPALLAVYSAQANVVNATFADNVTSAGSGAVTGNVETDLTLTNVAFLSNRSAVGGAVWNGGAGQTRLVHASFFDNRAPGAGSVYNEANSSVSVANSVFWSSTGSGPDLVNLGTSELECVAGSQTFIGACNGALTSDPFERPLSTGPLFLNQSLVEEPTALNRGSNAVADDPATGFEAVGLPPWSELTTAADGRADDGTVDLGRHYSPLAVQVGAFAAEATRLTWRTTNSDACNVYDSVSHAPTPVDASALAEGSRSHAYASGTELTLICFGAVGEPAVAFARVD
jgi:predicted outer membrane repeat protein